MSVTDHRSASGIRIVSSGPVQSRDVQTEVLHHLDPLVRYIAERHRDRVTSLAPLVTAGRQGLRDVAAEIASNPQSRDSLSMAVRAILGAVRREVARQALRPSVTTHDAVRRAVGQWESVHGRSPAVSELADLLRLPTHRILGDLDQS